MPQTRQLAAIMFTDIVGYTALMGKDEQKAFQLLNKNRQIQKPIIEEHNGRWIKELGDGIMASFLTVSDAVNAAIKIQETCNATNEFQLRIGIHLGEVVFDNDDVFGDGVNIASRIQAIANPGGIYISETVYNNISNKKDIRTQFVKTENLKNVREPVRIYQVIPAHSPRTKPDNKIRLKRAIGFISLAAVIIIAILFLLNNKSQKTASTKTKKSSINSIAVLYFNNMTGDAGQEYFCDGITEEITSRLSRIKGLYVPGRTSLEFYKGKSVSLIKIAEELKVDVILEGSVRKSGNLTKITAQLIDGKTGYHLWSLDSTKEFKDIFEAQSDIALTVARKLEEDINPETVARMNETGTRNAEAYDNFLKGKFILIKKYYNSHKNEDFEGAKKYLEQAIQLDPSYADPYAALSDLYDELIGSMGGDFGTKELYILKEQLARKALQLNPNSAYVNAAMAGMLFNRSPNRDVDSAFFYIKRSLSINPKDPLMNWGVGAILSNEFCLNSQAISFALRAVKYDPLNPDYYVELGHQYAMLGKYTEAKQALLTSFKLITDKLREELKALFWLTYLGEFDIVESRLKASSEFRFVRSCLYAYKGEHAKIDSADRNSIIIVLIINRNKMVKDVIKRLEKEIDNAGVFIEWYFSHDFLSTSHLLDNYRDDPDFKRILAKARKKQESNFQKYGNFDIPE